MNYDLLNEMIKYIEDNLTEDIEYKKLAKIVGLSEYSLQRIFVFLTGISISEYIRKRRLSKALEEIKTTNQKIIDIAIKYKYESDISFSRTFKQYFNMTPTESRNSDKSYKLYPVIVFSNNNTYEDITYEIETLEEKIIYCYEVTAKEHEDLLYKIRKLYKNLKDKNIYNLMKDSGLYAISIYDEEYKYYVGSTVELKDTKKMIIESGTYAKFVVNSTNQKDIIKTYDFVYNNWLKSTNYKILDKPEIEFYENDKTYIYFKVKDKQN